MKGSDIKALRLKLGLSQMMMAVELGVSLQSVHRWEVGKARPSQLAERRLKELANGGGHGR